MPSSFMVKRNYAHCPLKKRPLALYNEPAQSPEQDQPEDLSVKRPRLESPEKLHSFLPPSVIRSAPVVQPLKPILDFKTEPLRTLEEFKAEPVTSSVEFKTEIYTPAPVYQSPPPPPPSSYYYHGVNRTSPSLVDSRPRFEQSYRSQVPPSQENTPSLAEYYLQLFRSTSEEEAIKRNEHPSAPLPWQTSTYLPPSPQTSPVNQDFYRSSPVSPVMSPHFYSPVLHSYPDSSALISPVSTCSSAASESEDDASVASSGARKTIRHTCDSCGKSYSTQSGLRKHNELHCSSLGPRAFSCKHCAKSYTSVGALKMHIRTHTLPCKCHVCGKAFSRPWLLQGHIRTHTGEKPFECNQCHRSFADRSNLRAHQQTHERVKKYACQSCKKTFSRMSLLNKHSENACVAVKSLSSPVPSPTMSC